MKKEFIKSGIYAGLIAGMVFMILEMLMVKVFMGGSPWGPPRMIAAIGMGKGVLPPPPTFDFTIVMVAMVIHFILAILFAFIIALIVTKTNTVTAIIIGMIAGLLLYFINFYGFTALFPWFAMARNWVTIFTHIMFGLTASLAFKSFYKTTSFPVNDMKTTAI
ncbi:MAG: hypothetical protein M3Z56_10660 [Bacteroidota bacterium]|nr:hypothetical protein [Bacteroidota bacterium]